MGLVDCSLSAALLTMLCPNLAPIIPPQAQTDEDMQQLYLDNLAPDLAPFQKVGW